MWEEDEVGEDEVVGKVDHREEEKRFGELEVFLHITCMCSQLEEVSSKGYVVEEEFNSQLEAMRMEKWETGVTRWRERQDEQQSCTWQPPRMSHQECC